MKTVDILRDKIVQGKKKIDEYPLTMDKGTTKVRDEYHRSAIVYRNKFVKAEKKEMEIKRKNVQNLISEKVKELLPIDISEEIKEQEEELKYLEKIIFYCNENRNIAEKLGFSPYFMCLFDKEELDLETANKCILDLLSLFQKYSIFLTYKDFSYSLSCQLYMKSFFENMESDDFFIKMKSIYEEIYWDCPNLLTHIRLSFYNTLLLYRKQLEIVCLEKEKSFFDSGLSNENVKNVYYQKKSQYLEKIRTNLHFNFQKFLNGEFKISDYLEDSAIRKEYFFSFLLDEDKEKFSFNKEHFEDIFLSLYWTIEELEGYYQFLPLLNELLKLYKERSSFKGQLSSKLKEIEKEEKVRKKLIAEYKNIQKSVFLRNRKKDKLRLLQQNINQQIEKLSSLYQQCIILRMQDFILNKLNDGSTYLDLFRIADSNQDYLRFFFSKQNLSSNEIENMIHKFFLFCYAPHHSFLNKITVISDYSIASMICEKYRIFHIALHENELLAENLLNLKEKVLFILRVWDLSSSNISIEDIQLLIEAINLCQAN